MRTLKLGSFALTFGRQKTTDLVTRWPSLVATPGGGGWWPVIREANAGDWQKSIITALPDSLAHPTFWACVTLIAGDIAKGCFELMQEDADGISSEVESTAFSPVLRRPNHYQNRSQFIESWVLSKLLRGNAFILKTRDARGVVNGLYPLDATRVRPVVAPNGDVYYALGQDLLNGVDETNTVAPARDIIHDRWNTMYHPLIGLSPVYAAGASALRGIQVINKSTSFLTNGSQLGGLIVAPGAISEETAKKLEQRWNDLYTGKDNVGKVAVLGDGLKFEKQEIMSAVDAQVIEQLKWDDEKIASVFHVPGYMVNVGQAPTGDGYEARMEQYYGQACQPLIEAIELCLEEGLGADAAGYEVEYDLDALVRMIPATKMKFATDGIKGGIFTPNEARAQFNLPPIKGGDTVYLQEQDHSLAALAERDAGPDPFGKAPAKLPAAPAAPPATKSYRRVREDELFGSALRELEAEDAVRA